MDRLAIKRVTSMGDLPRNHDRTAGRPGQIAGGGGRKEKKYQEKCWSMRRECTSLVYMVDDMEERDARAEEKRLDTLLA